MVAGLTRNGGDVARGGVHLSNREVSGISNEEIAVAVDGDAFRAQQLRIDCCKVVPVVTGRVQLPSDSGNQAGRCADHADSAVACVSDVQISSGVQRNAGVAIQIRIDRICVIEPGAAVGCRRGIHTSHSRNSA